MTPRKSGAARAHADEPPKTKPPQFNVRPDAVFDVQIRTYLLQHGITFNALALEALRDYLRRHPRWPYPTGLKLPRGRRPKITR